MRIATADWLAGSYACRRPCTAWVGAQSCCDGIYLPTFFFRCWLDAACCSAGMLLPLACHRRCSQPPVCPLPSAPSPRLGISHRAADASAPAHLPSSCRNAFGFPQDRATGYKLYVLPEPNSSLLWTQFVHGVFYQARGEKKGWPAWPDWHACMEAGSCSLATCTFLDPPTCLTLPRAAATTPPWFAHCGTHSCRPALASL